MNGGVGDTDPYLQSLKVAKDSPAVIKVDLAALDSALPADWKIFAYEGPADKIIYYGWIKSLAPGVKYEPFVCRSKCKVMQLFDVLRRDLTGLGRRIYFFVDRDFDGLQGREPTDRVFITEAYSIENYVVCPEVLDDLLKVEFHCEGYPAVRERVRLLFSDVYEKFLNITSAINFRIFLSRKLKIDQLSELPTSVDRLAIIELSTVHAAEASPAQLVVLDREPSAEEVEGFVAEFEAICPQVGYRGKFSLAFFVKWLGILRADRLQANPTLFNDIPPAEFKISGAFSLDTLAPKAPPPGNLPGFLQALQ